MRKSGWTVASGLGSVVLLLTACGGSSSSSTSTTGAASGTASQSTAAASSTGSSSSSSSATSASSNSPTSTANPQATHSVSAAEKSAEAKPSTNEGASFLPIGTTVLIVQRSSLGFVMAKADGIVVYTYAKDSKNQPSTCTGSCASVWAPVTGVPKAGPADNFPGSFGLVTGAGGKKQVTYNGYPLYTYVGAPPLSTKGDGIGGVWHVIKLSESDISGA